MKVLIVDDNAEDRTLLRDIVKRNGHQPIEAINGQEALELAASHTPDLIITDILMPVIDGFRLCKKIREDPSLKATPLIFYSASYTESKDQALGDFLGADGYLIKPMDPLAFWPEVERILDRAGSSFRVSSAPDRGCGQSRALLAKSGIKGCSERVLIVDDEPAIAQMEQKMLESLGYRITTLISSNEALTLFRAAPASFDLVLTDMTMPEMSGVELAAKLLSLRPDLPIILCTGFNDTINEEKAKGLGVREYILKPIVKRELAGAIHKALGKGAEAGS